MAWRGCDPAIEFKQISDVRAYIRSLNYSSWRPSGMTLHNTASPTLQQWWNSVPPAERMVNLRHYYENEMGWSAGPHAFIDGVSWWIFTPFNVKGVHSPSWNGSRLGFEMVGDYNTESDETGLGATVMEMTVALTAECCEYFGWEPNNDKIKLHKEDPQTTHDCPGRNVVKSEFISDVTVHMGEGGDSEQPPFAPAQGTVGNLVAGDTLNVRAASSSSAPVIGVAENGDVVSVVAEAWNGSTKWYKIQFGNAEGIGVAIFGWASASYITLENAVPVVWRENITATEFGGGGDHQDSAYPDIDWINDSSKGIALPYKWKTTPRPKIEVAGPSGSIVTDVIDLGPWNTNDPNYVLDGMRPLVEKQYSEGIPAQNGQVPTNNAAIDLTPPIANAVGVSGKGIVKWRFV